MFATPIVRHSVLLAVVGLVLSAAPAHATLGSSYSSVETDRLRLAASSKTAAAGTFSVHTLTLANHGVVKEFTRSDGTVFAITWHAPGRPDLRQLLGGYFDAVQTDNVLPGGRRTRKPLAVNRSDFVVQSGGHPGAFFGAAVLPHMAPSGFSGRDLQ